MKIHLQYFASLREQIGKSQETIETNSTEAGELLKELYLRYPIKIDSEFLKVAINGQYQSMSYQIKANDKIVFIPPVSGG